MLIGPRVGILNALARLLERDLSSQLQTNYIDSKDNGLEFTLSRITSFNSASRLLASLKDSRHDESSYNMEPPGCKCPYTSRNFSFCQWLLSLQTIPLRPGRIRTIGWIWSSSRSAV